MDDVNFNSIQSAVEFSMQLNRISRQEHKCFVTLQKDKNSISIVDTAEYPIEKADYATILLVDTQQSNEEPNCVNKWKELLDRLSVLNGVLLVSIQYTPSSTPKTPVHESN